MKKNCPLWAHELTIEQINRAQRLYAHLEQWKAVDTALQALAAQFPKFNDLSTTLLKVVAVNSLYATRLLAVMRMAKHIQKTMTEAKVPADEVLVDLIAALPPETPDEQKRHHVVFASKFAHFFISPERFLILDRYSEMMLKKHLGGRVSGPPGASRYTTYAANIALLKLLSGWDGTNRELDHYLWLAGTYCAFRKDPNEKINSELRDFFANPKDAEADLQGLLTPSMA